ncbi:F-box-like domain-containing protein [Candidatus Neptunochlamydia vexilliferae]|uniref:F-box domain-containing protein n=1 Tax=Candidatus Neptunichlamydia vexilliferae TaxID=1651774 RepID=A0ABS0B0E3_9BACT|nr:F-box-like domain-containing protein [Candidatus Neptunochlamydia vexilliferae]MBF5059858.1 hypothetical protein [Candidatus Neptunochlamydia vexilliferae]
MSAVSDYEQRGVKRSRKADSSFQSEPQKRAKAVEYEQRGIAVLPSEVLRLILSYACISTQDEGCMVAVCKRWKALVENIRLDKVRNFAFGKKDWEEHFGTIGDEPPVPSNTWKLLHGRCPFGLGKRIKDSHLLALIPKTIDGEKFSLNSLIQFINGDYNKYRCKISERASNKCITEELGNRGILNSRWILITHSLLQGSKGMGPPQRDALIKKHTPYHVPPVLDAITAAVCHYLKTGKVFLKEHAYMRCYETTYGNWSGPRGPISVGSFNCRFGFHIHSFYYDTVGSGVGLFRNLSDPDCKYYKGFRATARRIK